MTLEEKAEEYCRQDDLGHFIRSTEEVKQAYIAGAKENGSVWHDLRKDPNDLPGPEGGWVCNQDGLPCFYDWHTEQWLDAEGTQIKTSAWCDMQRFEEE